MSERADRIDELDGRVRELQATVTGLTEELVEANERIRQLESRLGVGDGQVSTPDREQQSTRGDAPVDQSTAGQSASGQSAPATEDELVPDDEIEVAGPEANGTGDATSGAAAPADEAQKDLAAGSEDSTDQRDSDGDDIIIA